MSLFSAERFAWRCARRGFAEPNPMVGCILVRNNQVIAEGYHQQYGGPHAEPNTLANCQEDPRGATAYVTLEPCCHTNKKTPPCAPRLIEAGITRVVIGCLDPNPDVNGQGVTMLRAAGIEVDTAPPALASEFLQLIAPFTLLTKYERPYVTLKWAQTADGKIAGHEGMRLQISSEQANRVVHLLRSRSDAIVVGINTVLIDDPSLTVRDVPVVRNPERVILDRKLRTPRNCKLIRTSLQIPTVVVTSLSAPSVNFEPLVNQGVRVVWPPAEREDILQAAAHRGEMG
ncbi:MAG: bifunctional diaminohydroxyphosphoribosylaminopyrimidine deaminase/5-amino-6-(5-phosphoribosylamino)uracil reductase RibD [Pirellulales bacterium]